MIKMQGSSIATVSASSMEIPSIRTRHCSNTTPRVMRATIILCKYLWLLIILPKQLQLPIIALIATYAFDVKRVRIDSVAGCMFLGFVVQTIAVILQILFQHPDQTRLYAAINTDLIWLFSIMLYISASQAYWTREELLRIKNWLMLDLFILGLLYLVYRVSPNLSFSIGGEVHKISGADFMQLDGDGSVMGIRFRGFMETYLSPSHFFLIILPLYLLITLWHDDHIVLSLIPVVMSYVACMASHSRAGIVVCTSSVVLAAICILIESGGNSRFTRIVFFLMGFILVVLAFFFYQDLIDLIKVFFNARQGSNDARFEVYKLSLQRVLAESPLLGIGIKYSYTSHIPLGSHSTYIGVLYKAGIIGCVFYGIGFARLLHRLHIRCRRSKICISFYPLLCMYPCFLVYSDIDSSDWVISLAFLLWGILCALPNGMLGQGGSHDKQ